MIFQRSAGGLSPRWVPARASRDRTSSATRRAPLPEPGCGGVGDLVAVPRRRLTGIAATTARSMRPPAATGEVGRHRRRRRSALRPRACAAARRARRPLPNRPTRQRCAAARGRAAHVVGVERRKQSVRAGRRARDDELTSARSSRLSMPYSPEMVGADIRHHHRHRRGPRRVRGAGCRARRPSTAACTRRSPAPGVPSRAGSRHGRWSRPTTVTPRRRTGRWRGRRQRASPRGDQAARWSFVSAFEPVTSTVAGTS